jgi:hypothetical protein
MSSCGTVRGAKDIVHDVSSIAISPNVQVERRDRMIEDSKVDFALREFFRPYVLAFVALAIAFTGFSYGYKLSQYLHHHEVTRASLTRAWPDQRNDSISSTSHHQLRPVRLIGLDTVAPQALRVSRRSPSFILDAPAPVREAFLFSSLIPFRAPPSTNPSLA